MNRRDFLWHSGGGLGGIALAALLGPTTGSLAAADGDSPQAEGEARRPAVHGRRRQPHRPVRLQAGAGQAARPAGRLRRARRGVPERPRPVAQAGLGLQALRQVRQDARRGRRPARRRRRRDRVRPQHGRQDRRPQPGHAAADDRVQPPRLPRHGLLGELRPRQPEREPADVRRAARTTAGWRPTAPRTGTRAFLPAQHQGTVDLPRQRRRPIADLFPDERADVRHPRRRRGRHRPARAS